MSTIDARLATDRIVFTQNSAMLSFAGRDPSGTNSSMAYSWLTAGGDDIQTFGFVIDSTGNPPSRGIVTRIEIDLGSQAGQNRDVVFSAISGRGGQGGVSPASLAALTSGGASFFAEITTFADTIFGSGFSDILASGGGDDRIEGGTGNDILDGGTGADTLVGGEGNDTFIVDNIGDLVIEAQDEGLDGVLSSIHYTLSANIELLTLVGQSSLIGIGNELANSLNGNEAANFLSGLDGNDTLRGGDGNDELFGGSGRDSLVGGNDDDTLDGGAGVDTMAGGSGNDTYVIDNSGDSVSELANSGTDTIRASIAYTLGAHFENLTLLGAENLNGTGNALSNIISGNSGDNTLRGLDGNDTLRGGFGDDILFGGNGRDELDGGNGADAMEGGAGDDTYVVGSAGDRVIEAANGGNDTVRSAVTFTLGANVENLTLQGSGTINGTGNALDNRIIGSGTNILRGLDGDDYILAGSRSTSMDGGNGDDWLVGSTNGDFLYGGNGEDTLDGERGADVMQGGADDDFYFVDNSGDVVIENASGGAADIVVASISYALGANVEQLGLTGAGNISGTGNDLDNTMTGNSGANALNGLSGDDFLYGSGGNDTLRGENGDDVLEGGAGADRLEGGFGNDIYAYFEISDSGPTAATRDTIIGFDGAGRAAGDLIDLSNVRAQGRLLEFTFLGLVPSLFPEPTAPGALWLRNEGSDTLVLANVDGNGGPDFSIRIADGATVPAAYSASDFIL